MKRKKILVVDDDTSILEAVQTVFQMEGYEVYTCSNGNGALSIIAKEFPHLVVLDVLLSGEDGRDVTRTIRSDKAIAHIPIVLFSANPNTQESALEAGANAFLSKPFDIDELISLAQTHMR